MRGRKPVPTVLRALHGNPSGTPYNKAEPKPSGDLSDAPAHLSQEQKEAWLYALTHSPPGLLKRIDRGALVVWVVAEDLHRQATIMQAKAGLLWRPTGSLQPQQSPYLPIINRQALIMLKAASELGFTPVSRPRVYAGQQAPGAGFSVPVVTAPAKARAAKAIREPTSLDDYLDSAPTRETTH